MMGMADRMGRVATCGGGPGPPSGGILGELSGGSGVGGVSWASGGIDGICPTNCCVGCGNTQGGTTICPIGPPNCIGGCIGDGTPNCAANGGGGGGGPPNLAHGAGAPTRWRCSKR